MSWRKLWFFFWFFCFVGSVVFVFFVYPWGFYFCVCSAFAVFIILLLLLEWQQRLTTDVFLKVCGVIAAMVSGALAALFLRLLVGYW